jgi:hypothetical protein
MRVGVDPVQANGVEFVQRFEFGVRVPPTMREVAEFLQFVGIGVGHGKAASMKAVSGRSRINPEYIGDGPGRQNAAGRRKRFDGASLG